MVINVKSEKTHQLLLYLQYNLILVGPYLGALLPPPPCSTPCTTPFFFYPLVIFYFLFYFFTKQLILSLMVLPLSMHLSKGPLLPLQSWKKLQRVQLQHPCETKEQQSTYVKRRSSNGAHMKPSSSISEKKTLVLCDPTRESETLIFFLFLFFQR